MITWEFCRFVWNGLNIEVLDYIAILSWIRAAVTGGVDCSPSFPLSLNPYFLVLLLLYYIDVSGGPREFEIRIIVVGRRTQQAQLLSQLEQVQVWHPQEAGMLGVDLYW